MNIYNINIKEIKKTAFIFVSGILICSLLFLTSCREKELEVSTDDGILANNDIADFYFYYPSEFTLDKNASMISVFAPDNESVESDIQVGEEKYPPTMVFPNLSAIVYAIDGEYETIDNYWETESLPIFESMFSSMEIVDTQDLTIGECNAKRYDFTAVLSGMEFKYSQTLIIRDNNLYTLTYTATPQKFDKYINVLDTAIRTFGFKY